MTGMAALAMCAAFTSCSKDKEFEIITPEKQSELNYENAFKSKYGEIDPSHSWGFDEFKYKGNARTRAINVNGNQWNDCPTVADFEEQKVWDWVKSHNLNKVNPGSLTNYFVTQIHKGTDTYRNSGGGEVGTGSDKMNNLHIAMTSSATINGGVLSTGWEHINNFNAGNCTDWSGGTDNHGNTLVLDGGTFNFAYEGAEDSKYHDKWVSVAGADIDSRLAGYYYICFDFEQAAKTKTVFQIDFIWHHQLENGNWQDDNKAIRYELDGTYNTADAIVTATGGKFEFEGNEYNLTANMIRDINIESGNQEVEGDNVYDDWIIRLVEATPYQPFPEPDVRVLAEDLDVTETFNGQKYEGDFDFNDAVFDVIYNYNGTTWIIVQAAGGTYPLYVDGNEVHAALGSSSTNVMIHTDGSKGPSKPINLGKLYTDANDITVTVDLPTGPRTLEAGVGKAPHKLAVSPTFDWMSERVSIEEVHPNFSNWVKHSDARWY